jgi:hypothetical protein
MAAAQHHGAHAVLCCGDFGFYDEHTATTMLPAELLAAHAHSSSPARALGQLPTVIARAPGAVQFTIPVFVVPGRYEDPRVLDAFRSGKYAVKNLTIINEHDPIRIGCFRSVLAAHIRSL